MTKLAVVLVCMLFVATAYAGPSRGILVIDYKVPSAASEVSVEPAIQFAKAMTRGILVIEDLPPPTPIDPGALSAELGTMLPLWSDGESWSKVTVSTGLAWEIPQPKDLGLLCPDRLTAFMARLGTDGAVGGRYYPGVTLDWDLVPPYVSAYVGGMKGVGYSLGLKGTLFRQEF